jgi:FemAB-related protein (PEP-CTERM system-associated)
LSSVLSFYFRDTVLPYYAGDVPAARDWHANDFKYWALMCEARERGCRVFDYGRSKRGSGSYDFKKNWGCEPQPLFYQYRFLSGQAVVPQLNPNNPKYQLLIQGWRRLPRGLVRILGPMVARHFF